MPNRFCVLYRHYAVVNAVAAQIVWFACVLFGSLPGVMLTTVFVVLHFRFAPVHRFDWLAVCIALPVGVIHDNVLGYAGVLDFSAASTSGLAPAWLSCLWITMALTLNHALKWIYHRPWLLAVMGAVAGPLAYVGGIRLSDAAWGVPVWHGFGIMMLIWCWLLPLHRWLTLEGGKRWFD